MNRLTDIYSRRYPYFWSHKGTRDIVVNFMTTSKWVFAKKIKTESGTMKLSYLNLAVAFDIEDSSFYDQIYTMEEPHKVSTMYVWQFGIDNVVIMGRTWEEFQDLCSTINQYCDEYNRCIIYVHFLDHEFQFIRKLFKWSNVFSRKTRSPIYAVTGGIEFRDSYILTGKSLQGVAKDIRTNRGLHKRVGDLDYRKIRGTKTHLKRKEIGYCMADVQILNTYINEKIEEEKGSIARIPLTNTGYVRRYVRSICLPSSKDKRKARWFYYSGIHSLNLTPEEYLICKKAFAGGFTHAAAIWEGEHITGRIDSIDFTSSYPATILANPFPASSGESVNPKSQAELDGYLRDYLSIFIIRFYNLRAKPEAFENIISASKCWDVVRGVQNNGRLVRAITATTCMTNVDLECVKRFYDYDYFNIAKMYVYKKAYLPKPIIEAVLELYGAKTTLKGVIGAELEYMLKKGMLNSVY